MQLDFHYYATYCAAFLAGYPHEDCMEIAYSDQFVDMCSRTLLTRLHAPLSAATTQLGTELLNAPTDMLGIQDITRIWSSFHFLPYDLYAEVNKGSKRYKNKFRLICNTNGALVKDTVILAKDSSLQAAGIAMHVLADTWAHKYFAGTPSLVINNTDTYFYELTPEGDGYRSTRITFGHSASKSDDVDNGTYMGSLYSGKEDSIMNLGHGRAGHFPDYSFMRYKYLPSWGDYQVIVKDNPSDYYSAFTQVIYALKFLHGTLPEFETDRYDTDAAAPYEDRIRRIIEKRQPDACADWKSFGEELSGKVIEPFDFEKYQEEYIRADEGSKDDTFLGRFILAALSQKSMITNKIFTSGNMLAGISVDFSKTGFRGIRDYKKLVRSSDKKEKKK